MVVTLPGKLTNDDAIIWSRRMETPRQTVGLLFQTIGAADRKHERRCLYQSKPNSLLVRPSLRPFPFPEAARPNRVDLGRSEGARSATSFTVNFNVSCNLAGQSVMFMVTSADVALLEPWLQNSHMYGSSSRMRALGTCS
ncbi:hypothetical protein VOLCADRAFT_97519 [Volvox carteri f. nagariensis]|uniref:Uncharacterized protein n=1 Tax=Volvox carteri f. nagariensis TaxID=3068 RepID=D8UCY3_VOLCA|nr:uncharacterized protein VOLCADRAFT_97519 [Volvox carteri f. nagariensis]EFJ42422.1 hypothetical protein VOLCADRAFT_97519 [Volvox carteri f. nagariensis]|eukprot:XP_002956485.1 hypothetical protein VOLCADRAFT_97519 [Volvox carteri f. nagariensis]